MSLALNSRQPIQQLSMQLANQIAAGEVVERPASVVKELLENCLDAGASQIDIDIEAGGTQLIRIRDNGHGIPKEELTLALSPHATSKISTLDDLIHISSMGFRGEALASIASISELVLTSCAAIAEQEEVAWSIKSKEGQVELIPASHPVGTTVAVHNLFYNTPARRKFLKADRTEYRHIEDVIRRMALIRFDVIFNFRHNQRQVFSLSAALSAENKVQRLTRLINKDFIQAAVQLDYHNAGIKLSGWIASADYSRSQSDMQYFFVNGRMIRDKVITHAVRQAFQDTLYAGRFPVYVLHLELDADQVDVNVHPTKHEVRFHQSRLIHDFIFYSLREALLQNNSSVNNFNVNAYPAMHTVAQHGSISESAKTYSSSPYSTVMHADDISKPLGIAIAKLKNDYLISQNKHGLLVLQLSKVRQVLIEKQIADLLSDNKKLISKPVLIPFNLNLTLDAEKWLAKNEVELQRLGFEFALLGEEELMLRQVPAVLNASDLKNSMKLFIDVILDSKVELFDALIQIMVNDEIGENQADWNKMLRELEDSGLDSIKNYYYQLSEKDLESWFKK